MWPRFSISIWTRPGVTGRREITPSKTCVPGLGPWTVTVPAPGGIVSHTSVGAGGPVDPASIVQLDPPAVTVNRPAPGNLVKSTPTSGASIGAVAVAAGDEARALYPLGPSSPCDAYPARIHPSGFGVVSPPNTANRLKCHRNGVGAISPRPPSSKPPNPL